MEENYFTHDFHEAEPRMGAKNQIPSLRTCNQDTLLLTRGYLQIVHSALTSSTASPFGEVGALTG